MTANLTAEQLLDQAAAQGLTVEDLIRAARESSPAPTVSTFLPKVVASAGAGACKTYKTYWNDLEDAFGDTPLNKVTTTDLKVVQNQVKERAKKKNSDNAGRGAEEHFVSAAKCFFKTAVEDGVISDDPAAALKKPRRGKGKRRPLTEKELREVFEVVHVGSDDPELDRLITRFHTETGARRAGALNLDVPDLDFDRQTLWLSEKYDQKREVPVSKGLLEELLRHAKERGHWDEEKKKKKKERKKCPVFHYKRYKDGTPHPLTHRRYNTLFPRLQKLVSFSTNARLDSHTLRTTAIALVERVAGHEVARTFAGHAAPDVTSGYAEASLEEVAAAISHLTGEPHPRAEDMD